MSETSKILRHLDEDYSIRIRDPIWKDVTLSDPLAAMIGCGAFQKLHRIKQLGPTYLIYPGATHTRFSHSLGVFHLARLMARQLAGRARPGQYTLPGIQAFLCAALLHDLGHYPYAHSLKDLKVAEHEHLTARRITENDELASLIRRGLGVSPEKVAEIIDHSLPDPDEAEIRSYRRILSGVLDPDKLDYLNRDAAFCGVPYGIQDFEFICSQLEPVPGRGMGIRAKGLPSVESILFSKYLMYRNVYWHERVRTATAMIKKAVYLALIEGIVEPEDLYGLDDGEFVVRLLATHFPPCRLVRRVSEYRLYRCAARAPFRPENPFHRKLESVNQRAEVEARLADRWAVDPDAVIIDLPERISFEMDLPVVDGAEMKPYDQSGSVFNAEVVGRFAHSLRTISLLVRDEPRLSKIPQAMDIAGFFEAGAVAG